MQKKSPPVRKDFKKSWGGAEALGGEFAGSNNWVIAPHRTQKGHALLANDPHFDLNRPPLVFWSLLDSGSWKLFGGSVPGIPVVISGTNERVSWGITNAYMDVSDVAYVLKKEVEPLLKKERPEVLVKMGPFYFRFNLKTIYQTQDPLVKFRVLPFHAPSGYRLLLKWSGFWLQSKDVESIFDLPLAKSALELQSVIRTIKIPTWNFVMADREGNIAYQTTGWIPKRTRPPLYGVPKMPYRTFQRWRFLLDEELPQLKNPSRGYIITANHRHWPASYKYHLGRGYHPAFRAKRLEELIGSQVYHTVKGNQLIQCDSLAVDSRYFLPLLTRHLRSLSEKEKLIREWAALEVLDFTLGCEACGGYRFLMDTLKKVWRQQEPGLYRLLSQKALTKVQQKQLERAFRKTKKKLGGGTGLRSWGKIHIADFPHLSPYPHFKKMGIASKGDRYSVAPGTASFKRGRFHHEVGAIHRLVIEMRPKPQIYGLLVGDNLETNFSDDAHASKTETSDKSDEAEAYQLWQKCHLKKIPW